MKSCLATAAVAISLLSTLHASAQVPPPPPAEPPIATSPPPIWTPQAAPIWTQPPAPIWMQPPPPWAPPLPPRGSVGLRNTGIVFTALASVHLLVGLSLLAAASSQPSCNDCDFSTRDVFNVFGVGFAGASVVLAAVGVPMLIVGAVKMKGSSAMAPFLPSPDARGLRWTF